MSEKRSGGCLCGAVRYEASWPPIATAVCHCKNCQKQAGSALSVIAIHCREQHYKIRVNSLVPGGIKTPMTDQAVAQLLDDDPSRVQTNDHGMGEPIDIANMVLYLACDDGRHLTGANIVIDHGETIG